MIVSFGDGETGQQPQRSDQPVLSAEHELADARGALDARARVQRPGAQSIAAGRMMSTRAYASRKALGRDLSRVLLLV